MISCHFDIVGRLIPVFLLRFFKSFSDRFINVDILRMPASFSFTLSFPGINSQFILLINRISNQMMIPTAPMPKMIISGKNPANTREYKNVLSTRMMMDVRARVVKVNFKKKYNENGMEKVRIETDVMDTGKILVKIINRNVIAVVVPARVKKLDINFLLLIFILVFE